MVKYLILLIILSVASFPGAARANTVELQKLVARKAAIIKLIHRKARRALVTAARDENFPRYFQTRKQDRKARIKDRIDHASLTVQRRFHVEEMCLIDSNGAEISRIVNGRIANDLAPDESGASFFKPGFSQKPGKAFVSELYMSPDADKWVIAYVTPIAVDGEKRAILHYEHGLDVYQHALNKGLDRNGPIVVAVSRDGRIVSDSRKPVPVKRRGGSERRNGYFAAFRVGGMSHATIIQRLGGGVEHGAGVLEADGRTYAVAYKAVENWTLFALERR